MDRASANQPPTAEVVSSQEAEKLTEVPVAELVYSPVKLSSENENVGVTPTPQQIASAIDNLVNVCKSRSHKYAGLDFSLTSISDLQSRCAEAFDLRNSVFEHCRFQGMLLESIEFDNSVFKSVDFTHTKIIRVTFRNCRFENCSFDGSHMAEVTFDNSSMSGMSFIQTSLLGSKFRNCKIILACFNGANLAGSDFSNAAISDLFLHTAIVSSCMFRNCLIKGSFIDSQVLDSNFDNCAFVSPMMSGATFRQVSLGNTSFGEGDFTNAKFYGCSFRNSAKGSSFASALVSDS